MKEAVIVSAVRTPVAKYGGSFASLSPIQLGAIPLKAAVERTGIDPAMIDEVIYGNVANVNYCNISRAALLEAGLPIEVPGISLNRACGTALNAVAYAAMLIMSENAEVVVAGGVESDSQRPYVLEKPQAAYQYNPPRFLAPQLSTPEVGDPPMGITAENLAQKYNLTRQECDEFALWSHQKATKAWEADLFNEQIIPVEVSLGKGKTVVVNRDEIYRPDTTLETLARLKPAFKADGIVTGGNSSPLCDGAAAVVVMEKQKAKAMGLEILATIKGYAAVGVDPNIMGIGPVPATKKLLARHGLTVDDLDLIEMNEAFAAQSVPCMRELNFNPDKLNVNGGAISLGHPMGGTGAVLTAKIVYEMKRRDAHLGLITFCCGGGQGVSVLVERE